MTDIVRREAQPAPAAAGSSFPDLVARFLASLDRRDSSKATYKRALNQFGSWTNAAATSGPLTAETILDYKRSLTGRSLAPFTINSYLTAVKRFFAWSESVGLYPNIARNVEPMKRDRGFRKDSLTPDQARQLLKAIETQTAAGKRNYAIINLVINTGLRMIEVIRADRGDIVNRGDATVLYVHGKGRDDKNDFVVLEPSTLAPINEYLRTRAAGGVNEPLFTAAKNPKNGGRMTTRSVSRMIKAAIERVAPGNPRLTAHSLRHSAVTFALLAGATVQEAQVFARHSNINTTLIYAHNIDRIGAAPERKIAAFLNQ